MKILSFVILGLLLNFKAQACSDAIVNHAEASIAQIKIEIQSYRASEFDEIILNIDWAEAKLCLDIKDTEALEVLIINEGKKLDYLQARYDVGLLSELVLAKARAEAKFQKEFCSVKILPFIEILFDHGLKSEADLVKTKALCKRL